MTNGREWMPKKRQNGYADGGKISCDHINIAVGKVDHADYAIDHGVADGYQSIDRAEHDSVY